MTTLQGIFNDIWDGANDLIKIGLQAGSNLIGKVGIDQTTPGTTNGVQVNAALPAGTNLIGNVGIDQTTPGTTNAVVLTGRTTLLKTLTKTFAGEASGDYFFGNTVTNGYAVNDLLDISNYKYVTARIINGSDMALSTVTLRLSANIDTGSTMQIVQTTSLADIPAGSALWVMPNDYPEILDAFVGFNVHVSNGAGAAGAVTCNILGGRH